MPNPKEHLLALDQGTSSSRAMVFHANGRIVALAQREFRQIFPQPGLVEHDADDIWATRFAVAQEALAAAGLTAGDIAAIGITNQRETTVLWTPRPASRCTTPSSGRTGAPNRCAPNCARGRVLWTPCASAPAWSSTPISAPPNCAGCSTT